MANSSTITSTVAMYKKVPAEMHSNIPTTKGPEPLTDQPIAIPIGFITFLNCTSLQNDHVSSTIFIDSCIGKSNSLSINILLKLKINNLNNFL